MPNPNEIATFRDDEHQLRAVVCSVTPCPATAGKSVELSLYDDGARELIGTTYFADVADALAYARVCAGEPAV